MGETAEYQRLQETTESDYQRLPSDDEEVDLCSSLYFTVVGNGLISASSMNLSKGNEMMIYAFVGVSVFQIIAIVSIYLVLFSVTLAVSCPKHFGTQLFSCDMAFIPQSVSGRVSRHFSILFPFVSVCVLMV